MNFGKQIGRWFGKLLPSVNKGKEELSLKDFSDYLIDSNSNTYGISIVFNPDNGERFIFTKIDSSETLSIFMEMFGGLVTQEQGMRNIILETLLNISVYDEGMRNQIWNLLKQSELAHDNKTIKKFYNV